MVCVTQIILWTFAPNSGMLYRLKGVKIWHTREKQRKKR